MTKVVINVEFGGFSLSKEAEAMFAAIAGHPFDDYGHDLRAHPALVEVVETLGGRKAHRSGELKVVEIPDDVQWFVAEYDGRECVRECHRTWS